MEAIHCTTGREFVHNCVISHTTFHHCKWCLVKPPWIKPLLRMTVIRTESDGIYEGGKPSRKYKKVYYLGLDKLVHNFQNLS